MRLRTRISSLLSKVSIPIPSDVPVRGLRQRVKRRALRSADTLLEILSQRFGFERARARDEKSAQPSFESLGLEAWNQAAKALEHLSEETLAELQASLARSELALHGLITSLEEATSPEAAALVRALQRLRDAWAEEDQHLQQHWREAFQRLQVGWRGAGLEAGGKSFKDGWMHASLRFDALWRQEWEGLAALLHARLTHLQALTQKLAAEGTGAQVDWAGVEKAVQGALLRVEADLFGVFTTAAAFLRDAARQASDAGDKASEILEKAWGAQEGNLLEALKRNVQDLGESVKQVLSDAVKK